MDDEDALKARCNKYGIQYIERAIGEKEKEKETRWKTLNNQIRATQRREQRSNENAVESEERRRQRREHDREKRSNENAVESEERRRQRRENDREKRSNETAEESEERRSQRQENDREKRSNETAEESEERRRRRRESDRQREAKGNAAKPKKQLNCTVDDLLINHLHSRIDSNQEFDDHVPNISTHVIDQENVIRRGIKAATRTKRNDASHQATVCIICDRFIIGTEKVCVITKNTILNNTERLSLRSFEAHFKLTLSPILVSQYEIDDTDLKGILLSPRAYFDENGFECCVSCRDALRPSKQENAGSHPPKHAIANGFVIGHIPSTLHIEGEDSPRQIDLTDESFNDVLRAAVALQRPYGFIFALNGGAQRSIMGQYSFFETNQELLGNTINRYRGSGANDHILIVLAGRFTPEQKQIARNQVTLDTKLYVDILTWLIETAKHEGFKHVRPPEECVELRILEDTNAANVDEPQNPDTENIFQGGTFTFTSSQDPSENAGVFKDNTAFTVAMLNQATPLALVSGGKFISSGKALKLENIFPLAFPFGIGGLGMNRPTSISDTECLKHYLRLSLSSFMRGDIILVISHMFNRIQSFTSGLVKCRSKKRHGKPFGEVISTITTEDIKTAAENITNKIEDNSIAAQFLKDSESSCKAVGYSTAAAKANRRIMFAFCDLWGIPGVFFSLSPCDECAFRVRIWANAGSKLTMPSIDCEENECIADFQIRKRTRLNYPGACAIEYESIVQIVINILFGWDSVKQQGNQGIFGELLAWCIAHEEQGRKTLHGHYECWIKNLDKLRQMLFDSNQQIRESARDEFIRYTDKIMSSSYGDYELILTHTCNMRDIEVQNVADDDANPTSTTGRVNELFYDHAPQSFDELNQLQLIRDSRNKNLTKHINGKIICCKAGNCQGLFTTGDIIEMALKHHLKSCKSDTSTQLPVHKNRMDRATYGYPYDYELFNNLDTKDRNFWYIPEVRSLLLRSSVDVHDHMHRPSCFKKNNECRFKLPDISCSSTRLDIEEPTPENSNVTIWHRLDCPDEEMNRSTPFLIQTRRPVGCEYFNTHSIPASAIFGCNTNVQIGGPGHIYYTTLYVSKSTQKEDSDRYIHIGTKVIRRLMRMKAISEQNRLEQLNNDESNAQTEPSEDFTEGLSRMLSGMCASLSKDVVSPPLAHLIVSNDGSRFQYSHDTTNLLVSQAVDHLDGKDISCRIRTNKSKKTKKKVLWPDSSIDDYLHRPDDLEHMCYYEFTSRYEKICKKWIEIEQGDNPCDQKTFQFHLTHPGFEFAHLRERQYMVVPISYLSTGGMCRIKDLQKDVHNPSAKLIDLREGYAKNALTMFYPFRSANDLFDDDENGNSSYWLKFSSEMHDSKRFWKKGIDILHNIDDRETANRMKHATQQLERETLCNDSEDDPSKNKSKKENTEAIDFSQFDVEDEQEYSILEGYTKYTERTHGHLMKPEQSTSGHIISARMSSSTSLLDSIKSQANQEEKKHTSNELICDSIGQVDFPTIIQFVEGAFVGESYDDYQVACNGESLDDATEPLDQIRKIDGTRRNMPTLKGVAAKVASEERMKLDEKQYAAYEIIACSFILKIINDEDGNMSGSFVHKLESDQKKEILSHLKAKGGQEQLIMLLSGFAGAGKSSCVKVAQRFCFEFCQVVSLPWTSNTFLFTATTGAAASLFEGKTIHDAAFLNGDEKNISDAKRRQWKDVGILIIDEMSFFTITNVEKLDRRLKNIMGRYDVAYGGISIVWSGDFHQLRPVACEKEGALYEGTKNGLFEGSINAAIFLEESHRFDDDKEYGDLLKRLWKGETTKEDIDLLNTRIVGRNGVTIPENDIDSDIAYACPTNKQRNSISAGIFYDHLQSESFPTVDGNILPPEHTVIIEADIQSMNSNDKSSTTRVSQELRERIISTCGDSDCKSGQSKLIDPCLRTYQGSHSMCTDNSKLKTINVGNGTQCRMRGIKLKLDAPCLQWKNWDGKKVCTINARYVDYALMERFPVSPKIKALEMKIDILKTSQEIDPNIQSRIDRMESELEALKSAQYFRLSPVKTTATVNVSLDNNVSERLLLSGVIFKQLPLNMNDATTGHKLQGMSKDKLIVVSWTTRMANWIYVVLSRVRTLDGLFLLEELSYDILDKISVPRELKAFEKRMKDLEENILNNRASVC